LGTVAVVCFVLSAFLLAAALWIVRWDVGSKAEWFSGAGAFAAVAVALWQTRNLQRQAQDDIREAHERLRNELAAAEERSSRELEAAEQRSARELQNARELHQVELNAQRELARVQRVHLREQEFKLALIRVSKAINAYTHELATLTEQGSRAVDLREKQDREDALLAVSEKLGTLLVDVSLEIQGAHMLTRNDDLHGALDDVNAAMMFGPQAEVAFRNAVIAQGRLPQPNPIPFAQKRMQEVIGNARRLAGELLDTGWD
jgi:hypothetical protein